jgi:hypothetical protein
MKWLRYRVLIHVDKVVEAVYPGRRAGASPDSSGFHHDGAGGGSDDGEFLTRRPAWRLGTPDARGKGSHRSNVTGQRTYCQVAASQPRSWRLPHMASTPPHAGRTDL